MTSSAETVHVSLAERGYDIVIGAGVLPSIGSRLLALGPVSHAVVIADEQVVQPHAQIAIGSLRERVSRVDLITVPSGEGSKSVASLERLWRELAATKTDRKSVVVAIGGGVIGDLAGFVAASFNRGLRFFQVPTTLLAHVDSSVGGKVGINLPEGKNLVGAFWQPISVLIDTETLSTLPEREYLSGLAEVVKYGMIMDAEFFAWLEHAAEDLVDRRPQEVRKCVAHCCRLKAEVVRQDEREETGLRAILNYGHTFAHAFEAISEYGQWLHGEAVSLGMSCAARLAADMGRIGTDLVERQDRLLARMKLPTRMPAIDCDAAIAVMATDKKVEHGKLRFVLPTRLGHVELVSNVDQALVRKALEDVFDPAPA